MENGNRKANCMRDEFLEICPDAIRMLQELITDDICNRDDRVSRAERELF